jgi:hypothetical protein
LSTSIPYLNFVLTLCAVICMRQKGKMYNASFSCIKKPPLCPHKGQNTYVKRKGNYLVILILWA